MKPLGLWGSDDTPRAHKIVRIMLFLTSFSWSLNPIQDYMGESTPLEKIFTRMLPMMIIAFYCVRCPYREMLRRVFRPGLVPLLWYVGIGMVCGLSSVQPALALWKGMEILITLMWVSVSCRDAESTKREFTAITGYIEVLLWFTLLLALVNPARGFRASPSFIPWIRGYFPLLNPNAIGFLSVMALTRLLFMPVRYRALRLMVVVFMFVCAQSRTSYTVSGLVLMISMYNSIRKRQYLQVFVALSFAVVALVVSMGWIDTLVKIFMRGQTSESMGTLSGRTEYWNYTLSHVSWFGSGLATGSRSLIFESDTAFGHGSVNTHNSFVEMLIGTGYIGAAPYIVMIAFNIVRQCVRTAFRPSEENLVFLACAVIFAARSMTSLVLALFSYDFVMMMLFWAWLYTSRQKPPRVYTRPKPVVYEKTLYEAEKAE